MKKKKQKRIKTLMSSFRQMGLLSSITSTINKVGAAVTKPAVIVAAAVSNPVSYIKNPKETVEKFTSQPLTTQLVKGAVAGAALGAAATAKLPSLAKAAVSALPKSTTGKVVTIAAAPVVASAVLNNPVGAVKGAANVVNAQLDLGKTIANPSLGGALDYAKQHPIATTALGVGGLAVVGGGVGLAANTVATFLNTRATNENTGGGEAMTAMPTLDSEYPTVGTSSKNEEISSVTPITQATTPVSATGTRKKYKRRKPTAQAVNQKVNIAINNRSSVRFKNRH